jgi:transcriptional regulator with XRE-family HTH domain
LRVVRRMGILAPMDGAEIRRLRKRAGLTQEALAECIGVEQGTVSRWERNVERPRPRSEKALRQRLLVDLEQSATLRQLALIRNNAVIGGIFDAEARLNEVSDRALRFSLKMDGHDLRDELGKSLRRLTPELSSDLAWDVVRQSGLLDGSVLLARFFVSREGFSHLTHYEPFHQDGEFAGLVVYIVRSVPAGPKLPPPNLRYAEALHFDDLNTMQVIYRGEGWQAVKDLLENDMPP